MFCMYLNLLGASKFLTFLYSPHSPTTQQRAVVLYCCLYTVSNERGTVSWFTQTKVFKLGTGLFMFALDHPGTILGPFWDGQEPHLALLQLILLHIICLLGIWQTHLKWWWCQDSDCGLVQVIDVSTALLWYRAEHSSFHCTSSVFWEYDRWMTHLKWWWCQDSDCSLVQATDVNAAVHAHPELSHALDLPRSQCDLNNVTSSFCSDSCAQTWTCLHSKFDINSCRHVYLLLLSNGTPIGKLFLLQCLLPIVCF